MPTRPKHPCPGRHRRCPNLVPAGQRLCDACQHQYNAEYNHNQRPARHKLYNTRAWKELGEQVRAEEPFCRDCGEPTTQADHIIPVVERPDLALERSNLQGLCRRCHSRRTAKEHGRWG